MKKRGIVWLLAALVYGAFLFWYTDFGGPVSEEEIAEWRTAMLSNGLKPERVAFFEEFLNQDSGKHFLMVNILELNESPPAVDGASPSESADQLMRRYLGFLLPQLLKHASHPVVFSSATYPAIDLVGMQDAENWSSGALVRYKSRRAFMHIIAHPDTGYFHRFKIAALEKTIAFPIEPGLYMGDLRIILGLILLCLTLLIDKLFSKQNRRDNR